MSENKTAYINAYMQTLAGEGIVLTPRLVEVFSGVLSRQLIEDAEGNITQKTNFETLAKIFTFVATPADERPASPNSYTAEQIAAAQEAAEQAVSPVDPDTFTLAEALALGEDLPDTYHIVDALVTDPVTSDVAGLEDAVAAAAENYVYSTAEQAIIDGAETVDISFDVPYILADTLANLAAAEEGVLAGAESYSLTETEFAVPEAVESTVAGLGAALAEAVTGFFTAAEQAIIDGASNGDDVTIDVPYVLADTLANLAAADAEVLAGAESYSLTETEFTVDEAVESDVAGLEDAIAAAVDGYFTEAEQAIIDGATNGDEVVVTVTSYALVDTLANIQGADAGVLDGAESYTIEDSADNLVAATNVQQVLILAGAEAINVTGDATVAQMDSLINDSGYTNIGTYTLRDTVENLLDPAAADIVAGAVDANVEGTPILTVDEYLEIAAIANVESWEIVDTAENILAAGAEDGALTGADAIFATDVADLDQAFLLDALELGVAYDPFPSTLEEAFNAENLPAFYTIDDATVFDAGEVDVETADAAYAKVEEIIAGAQNSEDLDLDALFDWSVADTLENLEGAPEDVLAGADAYSLTDEDTDLGELTGDQYQLVKGAANVDDYTFTVVPADPISIESVSTVVEGNTIDFTVEMSHAVNVDRELDFVIEGVETDAAQAADPLTDLGLINGSVTILADETTAVITLTPADDGNTEGLEAFRVKLLDVDFNTVLTSGNVVIQDSPNAGQTFTLTTGVDEFVGGAGNDTFKAVVDGTTAANNTWTSLDDLDGGDGTDILRINDTSAAGAEGIDLSLGTIANIETMTIQAVANVGADAVNTALDVSGLVGLETVNVTKAVDIDLKLASTMDANISGATAQTTIDGGENVTVTQKVAAAATAGIQVDGAENVTITATDSAAAANGINVGTGTAVTGVVDITSTGKALLGNDGAVGLEAIAVKGGTTVTVTQVAAASYGDAATKNAGGDDVVTQGNITIDATADTTTVSVKQDAAVTAANAAFTTGGVTETASVKFGAIKAGDTLTLDPDAGGGAANLVFTAAEDMTAEEVAAAFASLVNDAAKGTLPAGDTQSGGVYTDGTYTGNSSLWTSGAASGDTVVFTSTTANTDVADLDIAHVGAGTAPVVTTTAGKAHDATAAGGVTGVVAGVVDITNGTALTSVTVDGFSAAGSNINGANTVLDTLNLSNGGAFTTSDAAATLDLTLEGINGNYTQTAGAATLNVTSNGNNTADLVIATVETLTVAGTGAITANGGASNVSAAKTITVTGSAGLNLGSAGATTALTSVDTSGTTGTVTLGIDDGTQTSYAGGAGVDNLTIENAGTAITKSVSLGGGNDKLTLVGATVAVPTVTLDGGADTDTLSTDAASAAALDGDTTFASKLTGFERLEITAAAGGETINVENLGFADYVTLAGTGGATAISNLANDADLVINADVTTSVTASIKDDATGTADVLNVELSKDGTLTANDLIATEIETVNLTATDVFVDANNDGKDDTDAIHTLNFDSAKATTLNIDGNAGLTLTLDANTVKLATIDASGMTDGGLTVEANGAVAMTITGGEGADVLTASSGATAKADVLAGGAGNDVLVAGTNGASLTGGDGNDLFVLAATGAASGTKEANTYSTIEDFNAGDLLQLVFHNATAGAVYGTAIGAQGAVGDFAKLTANLNPDTASFSNYVEAAMDQAGVGEAVWFMFNNSSYVVIDSDTDSTNFVNGTDLVIELAGVDLTNTSFNSEYGTVAFA